MIDSLLGGTSIPLLEQVVNFTQRRHSVLAGNVANMDTPGYQVRDLSPDKFEGRLRDAIQTRDRPRSRSLSEASTSYEGDPIREVGENLGGILHHDLSNVTLEQQLSQISKNQGTHNRAIAIMKSQFSTLTAAIREIA